MKNIKVLTNFYYKPVPGFENWIQANQDWAVPFNGGGGYKGYFKNQIEDQRPELNWMLNENSALMNAAESPDIIPSDVEAVGLQNYRRVFRKEDLSGLDDCDGLVARSIRLGFYGQAVQIQTQYGLMHVPEDFKIFEYAIEDVDGISYSVFLEWTMLYDLIAPCNTFVFKKDVFMKYLGDWRKFIKTVMNRLPAEELEKRDEYQRRALAFLSERFLSLWVFSQYVQGRMKFKSVDLEEHLDWKPVENRQYDANGTLRSF